MNSQEEWTVILDGCDFVGSADDVSRTLMMLRKEGEEKGGSYYVSPEFSAALKAFYSNPEFETSVVLLEVAPALLPMFEFNNLKNLLFSYQPKMYERDDDDKT
jgi:hypothetical protein